MQTNRFGKLSDRNSVSVTSYSKSSAKLRLKPASSQKNNLQRIEKPNGLDQLGSSIRWKNLL